MQNATRPAAPATIVSADCEAFVWPMTRTKAEAWWQGALSSHARGERLILAAVDRLARSPGPERVLFLAYTDAELAACRRVLKACPDVTSGAPAGPAFRVKRSG